MIQLNQGSSCLYHLNQWNEFPGDSENSIRLLEIFLDPFGAGALQNSSESYLPSCDIPSMDEARTNNIDWDNGSTISQKCGS
jgi:hypothetical protein